MMKFRNFIRNNKKIILAAIIGFILGSTGVYAATIIMAKEIDYSNALTSKTNVQDAIDELYEKLYEKKKLTIDLNGGTFEQSTVYDLKEGETILISTPQKTGYTFNGWSIVGAGITIKDGVLTMGSSDATITAKWTVNTYTIVYNCNGGSGYVENSNHTYGIAKKLTKNECYKITEGANGMVYQFLGWSTQASAETATYTDEQNVTNVGASSGTVTLYAVWRDLFSYTGNKNVINDGSGNWRIKFLTTGVYTTNYTSNIDTFLVGGGGKAKYGGGGGGYTKTVKDFTIDAKTSYEIVIGAGGTVQAPDKNTPIYAESSTAFGYIAKGGGASCGDYAGDGGSGGGAWGNASGQAAGAGGSDGSNGGNAVNFGGMGGKGQGTTTREFGEATGELYAGGGGGGSSGGTPKPGGAGGGGDGVNNYGVGIPGAENTGGGGGGVSADGGSGIVIIRNAR